MNKISLWLRATRTRIIGLILLVLFSIAYVLPTFHILPEPLAQKWPFKSVVNLGLDLQGGSYLVFYVDVNKALHQSLQSQLENIRKTLKEKGSQVDFDFHFESESPPTAVILGSSEVLTQVETSLKENSTRYHIYFDSDRKLLVEHSPSYANELSRNLLDQSVRVVRNRIDEFGVSEPSISTKGQNRIVVELPGVKDIDQAKALIGQTAKLEFRLVDEQMPQASLEELVTHLEQEHNLKMSEEIKLSEYTEKINLFAKGKIPETSEILFERVETQGHRRLSLLPYLLHKETQVSGADLQDAQVTFGQYREPEVAFSMKAEGGRRFESLTGENIGKRLAIVLDRAVKSAPVINSKIAGKGVISVGRGTGYDHAMTEAKNLSIVLRAGALPASLELQEQRVIGPSLGQDSIHYGIISGTLGCLLIFIFMIGYYRLSGFFATISLLLNLLFSFTILIGIGATLTLPGIAGLALIIGMGVDSNVLIFERIRDEIMEDADPQVATQYGFSRAFAAILDANVTHGIVGLVLYNFGTGPLKGFAVTLLIGIFTTLFCAVTVCRLMFDYYLQLKPKRISI